MSFLLHNLLHFSRLLHSLGLDVHAGRTLDVANALEYVDLGRRADFYFTLRSLLVHRHEDVGRFDEAFRAFWRPPPGEWSSGDLRAGNERQKVGKPQVEVPPGVPDASDLGSLPLVDEQAERIAPTSYSPQEVSRVKDFAAFTDEELAQAKALLAAWVWDLGMRRTRRWVVGRREVLDWRRLVRRNMRYGGEPLLLPKRDRTFKRRPLVLICDVSGSMERYARLLLHFVYSLSGGLGRVSTPPRKVRAVGTPVEAFLFATRLTRITRELTRHDAGREVPQIPARVPDWAGGTRIGDALRTVNVQWARRVMGHGPIVLLISDGWDRGDPDVLRREMSRLHRSSHRLIWLNPLLGSPEYQPLTRGMQAALPFIDDFLPVHNLASLEALAEHLHNLPTRRGPRTLRT